MTGGGYVVTGGTGALGHAVVQALAAEGARIGVAYRDQGAFQRLQDAVGAPLWGAPADLADAASATAFFRAAAVRLGPLAGVAALAGAYAGSSRFEDAPGDEWPSMLAANLATAAHTCRAALPHLLAPGGSVVTVGSRLAESGGAGAVAYAVAKAAVAALTRGLAAENTSRGVRFNMVVPSIIDTPANRSAMPAAGRSSWSSADEVARVVLFLLSPASGRVTGAHIPV